MFYALTHMEDYFFAQRVNRFIALAPCTKIKPWFSNFPEWHKTLTAAGLYAFDSSTKSGIAQPEINQIVNFFGLTEEFEPVSVQAISHFLQIGHTDRFQEFSENFQYHGRITPLIDLGKIKEVPIYMLVAEKDEVCNAEQAKWTAD